MNKKILLSALASVLFFFILKWQGGSLESKFSPIGIINFELAKTYNAAMEIAGQVGQTPLKINIAIDFLFLIAYSSFLFFSCTALTRHFRSRALKTMGFIFMELGVLVGVLDICENVTMYITLSKHGSNISAAVTYWVAVTKFGLAAIVLLYLIIAGIVTRFTKA